MLDVSDSCRWWYNMCSFKGIEKKNNLCKIWCRIPVSKLSAICQQIGNRFDPKNTTNPIFSALSSCSADKTCWQNQQIYNRKWTEPVEHRFCFISAVNLTKWVKMCNMYISRFAWFLLSSICYYILMDKLCYISGRILSATLYISDYVSNL